MAAILLLGKIKSPLYSYYAKEGLLYITIAASFSRQPSSCSKCIKLNIQLSCDVRVISNAKCARPITRNNFLVPLLISLRVLYLICYYKA